MPGNKDQPEYDPASRRPIVRDIVFGASQKISEGKPAVSPEPKKPPTEEAEQVRITRHKAPAEEPVIHFGRREAAKPRRAGSRASLFWSIGVVLAFAASLALLSFFSVAVIKVTPRQEFVEVDTLLRASASAGRDVALEVISFEDEAELSGPVMNLKRVEEKAKGQVSIFNAFSSEKQPLVAGTRLEAPGGKLYRLLANVTVPGAKVEDGKIVPQGIEVAIAADKAGEEYNLGLSDFSVPGFKGTPKFEKFYARSKTEVSGGFVGTVPVVSEEDVKSLISKAEEGFLNTFRERISSDLPEGVFLPEGAYEIVSSLETVEPAVGARGDTVKAGVKGTLKGLALKEKDIYRFLGRSYVGLKSEEEIRVQNWKNLSIEIVTKNFGESFLTMRLRGRAHFVWGFDEEELKAALIAAPSRERKDIFQNYSVIERAEIKFRPVWWRIFPKESSRVKIELVLRPE